MKWNHIMDCQPEVGEYILRIEYWPVTDCEQVNWLIGFQKNTINDEGLQGMLKIRKEYGNDEPLDFWWMYAKDFTFPEIINKE